MKYSDDICLHGLLYCVWITAMLWWVILPPVCMHPVDGGGMYSKKKKVTYWHLNEILKTNYTDGCLGGKSHYLVSSLFPLCPPVGPKLTLVLQHVHTKCESVHLL